MSLFFPTLTLVREFGSTLRLSSRLILTAEYLLMEALRMEVRKINIILIWCLWEFQMTLSSKEARRIGWESHVDEELKREAPVCLCCGGVIAWWDDISVIPGLTLDLPALSHSHYYWARQLHNDTASLSQPLTGKLHGKVKEVSRLVRMAISVLSSVFTMLHR